VLKNSVTTREREAQEVTDRLERERKDAAAATTELDEERGRVEKLGDRVEQLERALGAMQRMMMSLRPSILDAGLVAALEWLTRDFGRRTGIKTTFSTNREEIDASSEISTAAFRICQESLTNVLRHADASTVRIELFADAKNLTIEIRDNGRGVSHADFTKIGVFGIVGMRERARSLGGWLEIDTSADGTSVMLSLPTRNIRL